jgi:hypothetical protein
MERSIVTAGPKYAAIPQAGDPPKALKKSFKLISWRMTCRSFTVRLPG